MFSNAKTIEIHGKVVKSIITEDGGVLYQKANPLKFDITISDDKYLRIIRMFRGTNMTVDYGDGTTTSVIDETIAHTYRASGTYTIKMYGVETIFINLEDISMISNVSIPDYVTVAPPLFSYNNLSYAGWYAQSNYIVIDNLASGTKVSCNQSIARYWSPNKPGTTPPLPNYDFILMTDWNDFICEFTYIESEGSNTIEIRDGNGNSIKIPFDELGVSQGDVVKIVYTNDVLTLYINNDIFEGLNDINTSASAPCSGDVMIRFGINEGYIIYDDFEIIDVYNYVSAEQYNTSTTLTMENMPVNFKATCNIKASSLMRWMRDGMRINFGSSNHQFGFGMYTDGKLDIAVFDGNTYTPITEEYPTDTDEARIGGVLVKNGGLMEIYYYNGKITVKLLDFVWTAEYVLEERDIIQMNLDNVTISNLSITNV